MSFPNETPMTISMCEVETGFDPSDFSRLSTEGIEDSFHSIFEMMDLEMSGRDLSSGMHESGNRTPAAANYVDDMQYCMSHMQDYLHSSSNWSPSPSDLSSKKICNSSADSNRHEETMKVGIEPHLPSSRPVHNAVPYKHEIPSDNRNTRLRKETQCLPPLLNSTLNNRLVDYEKRDIGMNISIDQPEAHTDLLFPSNQPIDEAVDDSYKQYLLPLDIFDTPDSTENCQTNTNRHSRKSTPKVPNRHISSISKTKNAKPKSSKREYKRQKRDPNRILEVSKDAKLPSIFKFKSRNGCMVNLAVETLLRHAVESFYNYLCHAYGMVEWYAVGSRTYQCAAIEDDQSGVLTRRNVENELRKHIASMDYISERGLELAAKRVVYNQKYEVLCPFCECVFQSKLLFDSHKVHYYRT